LNFIIGLGHKGFDSSGANIAVHVAKTMSKSKIRYAQIDETCFNPLDWECTVGFIHISC